MPIEKALVLSTAHMPNADPHWGDAIAADFEHGHILLFNGFLLEEKMIPSWLIPIFQKAADKKCSYIVFDCDSDEDDGLEKWDW